MRGSTEIALIMHCHGCTQRIQRHFQNVMLVGMATEISKSTHTSVVITQDTTESSVPRLNVHTNQILVHRA